MFQSKCLSTSAQKSSSFLGRILTRSEVGQVAREEMSAFKGVVSLFIILVLCLVSAPLQALETAPRRRRSVQAAAEAARKTSGGECGRSAQDVAALFGGVFTRSRVMSVTANWKKVAAVEEGRGGVGVGEMSRGAHRLQVEASLTAWFPWMSFLPPWRVTSLRAR